MLGFEKQGTIENIIPELFSHANESSSIGLVTWKKIKAKML